MKLTSQQKERALQVASVIAASIANNGMIVEEKQLIHCGYTAVRLIAAMDAVCDAIENDDTLIAESMRDGQGYLKCRDVIEARKTQREAEEVQSETQTDSKPAKGGKAKPAAPPVDETVKTEE